MKGLLLIEKLCAYIIQGNYKFDNSFEVLHPDRDFRKINNKS